MNHKPTIQVSLSLTDKILELSGWLCVLVFWLLVVISYNKLPDSIPIHYNLSGKADSFGDKTFILTLPLIATLLFAALSRLNKFPHIFNYPVSITDENAVMYYTKTTRFIRYYKVIIVLIFGLLAFMTIQHANGTESGLQPWFFPLTAALLFIPVISFLLTSFLRKT